MDNNTMKQIKNIFTGMFVKQYKKKCQSYMVLMKSQFQTLKKAMLNERLNNLLQEIITNFNSINQLKDNTRDLEESNCQSRSS